MESGYVIAVGNPCDGFQFIVRNDGYPFETSDEAWDAVERMKFGEAKPVVIPVVCEDDYVDRSFLSE